MSNLIFFLFLSFKTISSFLVFGGKNKVYSLNYRWKVITSLLFVYAFRQNNPGCGLCLSSCKPKGRHHHHPGPLGVAADDVAALGVKPWKPVFRSTASLIVASAGTACDRPTAFFQSSRPHCSLPQDFRRCPSSARVSRITCLQAWCALVIEENFILWSGLGSQAPIKQRSRTTFSQSCLEKIPLSSVNCFLSNAFWVESAPQDKKLGYLKPRRPLVAVSRSSIKIKVPAFNF